MFDFRINEMMKALGSLSMTVLLLALLSSCMPEATTSNTRSSNSTSGSGNNTTTPNYSEPSFPLDGIFIQEGSTRSSTQFSLPLNFTDSFLIRGKPLSVYLRTFPTSTNFCLVGKYNYVSGQDKFLVLSAKPKSYTDLVSKTTEFYLQVEPSNDQANQNDCLTYNLTNSLYANSTSPSLSFSLQQVCSTCATAATSTALKLYFNNGEQVSSISVSAMTLTISGSSTSTGNSCVESTACKSRGYDCCLQSQCVKDGAMRPSALTDPAFAAVQEDVRLNPDRFILYPQYYFVCESRPGTTTSGGTTGGGTGNTDPNYEASIRLMELGHLHACLNLVNGEFSHCTLKFTEASKTIPGVFSSSSLGFNDDVNFGSLNPNIASTDTNNNIVKILYAGLTLYEESKTPLKDASFVPLSYNDDLNRSQGVNITATLPTNAQDDNLYITYKVDGSCEKIGTSLARCTKTYVQGSSDTLSPNWHDTSKIFYLPTYADVSSSANIVVKINGAIVPEETASWSRGTTSVIYNGVVQAKPRITFNSTYPIYQNQKVEITYYVNGTSASLVGMRSAAQATVNSMCTCNSGIKCNLKPLYNTDNVLINYECQYPTTDSTTPPANQTVYVSTRNVPHRYYDTSGVNYDENYDSAPAQELAAFAYTSNDILKPNNVSAYVGFNEIYGSFAKTGNYLSHPAKLVKVKKDQQYDILTVSGAYSSCQTCGNDYYTSLQRIFPQNFSGMGGGYSPDYYNSTRENSTGLYRSDDLLFGRACFVPATMIPWTHFNSGQTSSSVSDQRRARLSGQHFLFANGYSRDWYGFDYGSLIGSFDGVTWFSIGNQRRIKASSSKLYLAVNSYYSDLNVDSNFTVNVMETSSYSSTVPEHDTNSDGAECQRAHYCSTDNDCNRQLGFDYTCQNVAGLTTNWPQFDANANEIVGSTTKTLASLVGGTNGQAKRCVYRGRGAPCLNNLTSAAGTNFNGTSLTGHLACSPNNHCLLTTASKFNDRIARFANTPLAQNLAPVVTPLSDIVGLGARIIGRPFDYYGTKSIPALAQTSLNQNLVNAVCAPGRDIASATSNFELNRRSPATRNDSSDKLYGVGVTMNTSFNSKYLNACPATDAAGNALHLYDVTVGDSSLSMFTISQNLSSNLLDLTPLKSQNIYSSTTSGTVTSQITAIGYQKNACLRAPGASCFSDMECAPSNFIATKAKTANFSGILNEAEEKYWEEELICGNPDFKKLDNGNYNTNFSAKNNKCCRDIGKVLTVYTQTDSSQFQWCDTTNNTVKVAGVNTAINSINRYSRVHSGYDKMTCDRTQMNSSKTFALSLAASNSTDRLTQILQQYKTLDTINQRTCCTQHWVRSFASENGGGHAFTRSKTQTVDKTMFKHISWLTQNTSVVTDSPFECHPNNYANISCEVRSLTASDEEKYLNWAGSLELIGIPQVAVKTNDEVYKLVDDNQIDNASFLLPLNNSIKDVNIVGEDFRESASPNNRYYSAASYSKFNIGSGQLKKVFSENEFNCCVPSGQQVPTTVGASQCCTGYVANVNGPRRCCLPDFTNLTVYLNRYVSSEGRGLADGAYDPKTGYIKDSGQVISLANQKNLCCSGKMMTGVAISMLSIPIQGGSYLPASSTSTSRRFNYRTDAVDNNEQTGAIGSIFDLGVKWNNHVYCVPQDFVQE